MLGETFKPVRALRPSLGSVGNKVNRSSWAQKDKFHWHNVQNSILSQNLDPALWRTNGRCIYIKHKTPPILCLWSIVFSSWLHWGVAIHYLQLPFYFLSPQSLQVPSSSFQTICKYIPVGSAPTEVSGPTNALHLPCSPQQWPDHRDWVEVIVPS